MKDPRQVKFTTFSSKTGSLINTKKKIYAGVPEMANFTAEENRLGHKKKKIEMQILTKKWYSQENLEYSLENGAEYEQITIIENSFIQPTAKHLKN